MCPIKEKEKRQLFIQWSNLIPYGKLQECMVTVLLLTSTPMFTLHIQIHGRSTRIVRAITASCRVKGTKLLDFSKYKHAYCLSFPTVTYWLSTLCCIKAVKFLVNNLPIFQGEPITKEREVHWTCLKHNTTLAALFCVPMTAGLVRKASCRVLQAVDCQEWQQQLLLLQQLLRERKSKK